MNAPLLTVKFRSKRDLLLVRQHARQITRLFGFSAREQSKHSCHCLRDRSAGCVCRQESLHAFRVDR